MSDKIQIRMGGYGPPETAFSQSLKFMGDQLEQQFGDRLEVKYVWNIMDLGYKGEDILWLVESGILTLGYQSSSYLTDRVPALGFVDLPFLFENNDQARAAIDGDLGAYLTREIEDKINYRILGYFENGFRHMSNRLRPVRSPADLAGMKIRVLPSDVQAKTFELLGAKPLKMDLTEAIAGIVDGSLDAQENPFANTVTYGAHKYHSYHTVSGHFYISRPIFTHRDTIDALPDDIRSAFYEIACDAIRFQRGLSEREAIESRKAIEAQDCQIEDLTPEELQAFRDAVAPQYEEARSAYDTNLFRMVGL